MHDTDVMNHTRPIFLYIQDSDLIVNLNCECDVTIHYLTINKSYKEK
jgi:hypothetical protein